MILNHTVQTSVQTSPSCLSIYLTKALNHLAMSLPLLSGMYFSSLVNRTEVLPNFLLVVSSSMTIKIGPSFQSFSTFLLLTLGTRLVFIVKGQGCPEDFSIFSGIYLHLLDASITSPLPCCDNLHVSRHHQMSPRK